MQTTRRPFHPVLSLFMLLAFVLGGSFIGLYLGLAAASPFYDGTFAEMTTLITSGSTDPSIWFPMMIAQGCTAVFGFIVFPVLLMRTQGINVFGFMAKRISLSIIIVAILILFSFMVVDSVIAVWNKNLDFPSWMDGFEAWARKAEDAQAKLTQYLTKFDSFAAFLVGLIVIGIIPGIGEEILFRGIIQNEFYRGTKNIHLAIWISAILFSAIHVQFFGFFPRLLLGALFGYLYYWSGSLIVPIVAHFVNNGLIVLALYLYQRGGFQAVNPSDEVAAPWGAVAFAAITLVLLLLYFKKLTTQQSESTANADSDSSPSID